MKLKTIATALTLMSSCPFNAGPVAALAQTESETASIERLSSTPDLVQSAQCAKLPAGGSTACGPVAASNSLVWLARNGYPALMPRKGSEELSQAALAFSLAKYMGITEEIGTSVPQMLGGLKRYVEDKGYTIESLEYQGSGASKQQPAISKLPDVEWIKKGSTGKTAVLMLIGWYRHDRALDQYRPFAQHWVSVVGYGQERDGKTNPKILVIHDPAPRSGTKPTDEYVLLEELEHGGIAVSRHKHVPVRGMYKLTGDLKIKSGAGAGIMDGVVVLRLK